MQPLPTGGYRWASESEIDRIISHLSKKANYENAHHESNEKRGYILEVDLSYPEELHDLHQDMPMAPEHMLISKKDISPLMSDKSPYSSTHQSKKLVGTLSNKKNYVVHYKLLKLYLQLGMKLEKVHKVLVFHQEPFMAKYIAHIASLRSKSQNTFEKNYLKKLANSCYGKMIEDVRKYKEVRICRSRSHFLRVASSPFYECCKIYSETLVACFLRKSVVRLKSFHAIGLSILDYSKLHMYDLYYNYIIPSTKLSPVKGSLSIIMSDTDSFLFAFKGITADEFLNKIADVMDFSNYPRDHKSFSAEVSGHLGYLKDEMRGQHISGAVALKSKCYSIKSKNSKITKCKGVPKVAVRKLQYSDYKIALEKAKVYRSQFQKITSKDHSVTTTMYERKSLSSYDDKRFYVCNIHSLPYGHYKVKKKTLSQCSKCHK